MTENIEKTKNFFGAFIMTYERPGVLLETIEKIRNQTIPPSLILVVDNSESWRSRRVLQAVQGPDLQYLRSGYNSGPAGAAKKGLNLLTEKGFKWIYWGDDDNPPGDQQVFEKFFMRICDAEKKYSNIGIFGGRGGKLNRFTGRIRSLKNEELLQSDVVEVDSVPGGHNMFVNSKVIQEGILPLEKLFFGFEELDFCLRVREKGFAVLVNSRDWLTENYSQGLKKDDYRWKGRSFGKYSSLWREYYSSRNLLFIFWRNKYYFAFWFIFLKIFIKAFAGFRHGWKYGKTNLLVQSVAVLDFSRNHFGYRQIRT